MLKFGCVILAAGLLGAQPPEATEQARRAAALVRAGQAEAAIPIYQELVQRLPEDAGLVLNLSIAEFRARQYGKAAAHAARAAALNPGLAAAYLFEGASYYELADFRQALDPLRKATEEQPGDRNARMLLGETLLELQRCREALDHFETLAAGMPDSSRLWYGEGRALEGLAESARQRLGEVAPGSAYALAADAGLALSQRRFGRAAREYAAAAAQDARMPGLHAGLAAVYREAGYAARATEEEAAERALPPPDCANHPLPCQYARGEYRAILKAASSPESLYWTAQAYEALARQAYERLTTLPDSVERHLYAARRKDAAALYVEAAREWRAALTLSPGNLHAKAGLAWSLFHAGDFPAALVAAQDLERGNPASAEFRFLYGASLLNHQEPGQAVGHLEAALRADSGFLPAQAALGQALLQLGRAPEAIPHLKAALSTDADGSLHFQLARAYQLAGQADLAASVRAQYRALALSARRSKTADEAILFPSH